MSVIECDHKHCKLDICTIYDTCETRKKFGTKTADLTPLQVVLQEKEVLLKQLEEMKATVTAISVNEPKTEQTESLKVSKVGRPRKEQ